MTKLIEKKPVFREAVGLRRLWYRVVWGIHDWVTRIGRPMLCLLVVSTMSGCAAFGGSGLDCRVKPNITDPLNSEIECSLTVEPDKGPPVVVTKIVKTYPDLATTIGTSTKAR